MEFLNPLVLAALAAAAIPLIVHLFNFRRPRRVDFSSLAFVKELQKSTMQRVRIKQWLLLALRILTIACLVLAFARPTLTGSIAGTVGAQARSSVAFVIDNSLSMTLRDAEGEYLRQAKDITAGLIDVLTEGDEVFLSPGSGRMAERYATTGSAIEAVERIEASSRTRPLAAAAVDAARSLENASNVNRELYVISDLQTSALKDSVLGVIPDGVRVYLLPIGQRAHPNVAVTDVQIESRIVEVGQPVRLSATLVNYGSDPVDGYVASVFLDGRRLAQATATLEPGVPTTMFFTATPQNRGWLAGTVQIEDDAFSYDNERYFTLHVPERRRVLVVRGDGQNADFVELALSPEIGRGRVAFDVDIIPETGLAAAALGAYDAVLAIGPQSLSSGEVGALERYVAAGGGLFITPAAGAASDDYNDLLEALNAGRVSGFSGSLGSGRSIAATQQVDFDHPLFEGMFSTRSPGGEQSLESPEVYFALNYEAGTATEQTIIQLSNGYPFVQEIRHDRGVAFLLAVAPDARWSDLPVRGLFIPLIYRSMYYLSASESISGEQMTAAADAELRIPRISDADQLRLIGPDGSEYVPEQRDLFGAMLLTMDGAAVAEPGIYDVRANTAVVRRIPFNLDEAESDLATLEREEARARLATSIDAPVDIVEAGGRPAAEVVASIAQERTGLELWNLFLLLALGFLIAEMVIARQWRPETVPA